MENKRLLAPFPLVLFLFVFGTILVGCPDSKNNDEVVGLSNLFGSSTSTDRVYRINQNAGRLEAEAVSGRGLAGFDNIGSLVFDPATNTLLGIDADTAHLVSIDPATGEVTDKGPLGFTGLEGMGLDPATGTLFGMNTLPEELVKISLATGEVESVGITGVSGILNLAYDSKTQTLFGSTRAGGSIFRIDTTTGEAVFVVGDGFVDVPGLAFDSVANTLYALEDSISKTTRSPLDNLLTIDLKTGFYDVVGPIGFGGVGSLAFDSNSNVLYAVDNTTAQLIVIDPATGVGTPVHSLGFVRVQGVAFNENAGTLYGIDNATNQLITINPENEEGTAIAPIHKGVFLNDYGFVSGLTFNPDQNVLYSTSEGEEVIQIDPSTGAGTPLFSLLAFWEEAWTIDLGYHALSQTLFLLGTYTFAPFGGTTGLLYDLNAKSGEFFDFNYLRVSGLGYDPNKDVFYSLVFFYDGFPELPLLGVFSGISGSGLSFSTNSDNRSGYSQLDWMTFNPNEGVLYGIKRFVGSLMRVDPVARTETAIASLGFGVVEGLVYDPNSKTLYGIDNYFDLGSDFKVFDRGKVFGVGLGSHIISDNGDRIFGEDWLISVDPETGQGRPIGPVWYAGIKGLAFNPDLNVLYGSDVRRGELVSIDPASGFREVIGPLGFEGVEGLAFDPNKNALFGVSNTTDELIQIDPETGAGTLIGPVGFSDVRGLDFDAASGGLYGSDFATKQIIRIDPATGAGTPVENKALPFAFNGLAFLN